jgi:ABC-type sugar transport system substrate-binding protein
MDPRSEHIARLAERVSSGGMSRRPFLPLIALLAASVLAASTIVSAYAQEASPSPGTAPAAAGVDLEAWKQLLFVDGEYYQDPNYVGYNAGGPMGLMNLGNWPDEPLPWLSMKSPEMVTMGYTIFNSAWPLPVAYAARSVLDGEGCFGVNVLTYENELDPARGLQNAELLVEQGAQFVNNLQISPDVNDTIVDLYDENDVKYTFYAVPPASREAPFITLDDYATGHQLGVWLGEYARDNWDGQVDLILSVGNEAAGASVKARIDGAWAGIESVLGPIPDDKKAIVDSEETIETARQSAADFLTSRPDVKYILVPSVSDVASVGAVRALEAAGKAEFAAAAGLPGTPEGIDELRKGPGGSAFKVSAMTDIATQSWPIALGIFALNGGELPDVNVMQARVVTADNIDTVGPQTNDGYTCTSA